MRISMEILTDRLRQNYPDCVPVGIGSEMNLKRPLFYKSGADLKKNKVYIARQSDIPEEQLRNHGDNLLLLIGNEGAIPEEELSGVCFFPDEADAEELFNAAQRIFDIYDAWDERIQNLALSERTLKVLLDASFRILHNPIMVCTTDGFLIDYSSMMEAMPEFQEILQHNQVTAAQGREGHPGEVPVARYYQDPVTQKNHLYVNLYDKNRSGYRVILVEATRKLKSYDEFLLVQLAKYIEQMLEKYTVLQSDISYSLDRLLSNILTDTGFDKKPVAPQFEAFHWSQAHAYFCMDIHVSKVDQQNQTVVRFICNRLESLIPGSCAFLLDNHIVVFVNLFHYGSDMNTAVEAIAGFLQDSYLKAGVSYEFRGLGSLRQYYLQAKVALEEGMKRHPMRWVNRFEDIALYYLMDKCTQELGSKAVCSRDLQALRQYDREHKTDYYETLRAYITNQMNAVQAAKALFIHRSTFLYRMAHIKELMKLDLEDSDQLLYLLLSYKLLDREEED